MAVLALAVFAAVPVYAAASASSQLPFMLSPVDSIGSITLHGTRDRVLHGAVSLHNLSRRPITVILRRADIETASNGNAAYVPARRDHTGRWLRLANGRVHLAPHATREVAFTVHIPARASRGSHYAGIVAVSAVDRDHTTGGGSKGRAFTFRVISRQAVPLTIHLPGRLSRSLSLQSVKLIVEPIGAGLVLALRPGGTELTEATTVKLRVLRGARLVFTSTATLGQLFPGSGLDYRVGWPGRPTPGIYRVIGQIRPQGSAVININQKIAFNAANASQFKRITTPATPAPAANAPSWVWIALAGGGTLVIALSFTVFELARRPRRTIL